jgi:sialidase-1
VDVFAKGDRGVDTYRIPGMVVTKKGTILAFCEARKESSGDQTPTDMDLRRSFDGGASWQATQVVVKGQGPEAIMNPTPVVNRRDGSILLLCNRFPDVNSQFKPGAVRQLLLKSVDDGQSWSKPVDITDQVSDPKTWASLCVGPGMGIEMLSGRLVVPFWHHQGGGQRDFIDNVIYSDDEGNSWQRGNAVSGFGDESQVVELADGSLMLNIRSTRDCAGDQGHHRRKVAISRDGGVNWSKVTLDETLITPCCQASILRYSLKKEGADKNRLLFSNPASTSERVNMTIRLSYDEGKTWPIAKTVYSGPSAYSCLAVLSDGTIGLLYETGQSHRYEKIVFARLSLEWLTEGKDGPAQGSANTRRSFK